MNNPFDYMPSAECEEAFRTLTERLEKLKGSCREEDQRFCRELSEGKMLGVLVAEDDAGEHHALFAFSGQLGDGGFHYPGFVGSVFDYLQPDGYFKSKERDISRQSEEIRKFEKGELPIIREEYERQKENLEEELRDFREECRQSKLAREERRASGDVSADEREKMIRQSQFEKAELRRIKKRIESALAPAAEQLREADLRLERMKEKRRGDSESLQEWLFDNFKVLNARGEQKSLKEIFAGTTMRVPPSGAGECCGPKLLQAAYRRGWKPVNMAEYWYGNPKSGEVRRHGDHYPACRGKCLPVLTWMLDGVEVMPPLGKELGAEAAISPKIIYENRWFCVIEKPGGMLSVPGKGKDVSVQEWLEEKYGEEKRVKVAHRLDQDTSGLLIATFGEEVYKGIQSYFAERKISKTYIADLEGDYMALGIAPKGRIELPLMPDYLDRPRQRIDFKDGKEAVTDYEFLEANEGISRVLFYPKTGRTHQLRVHSAALEGLGMPIVGDRLYGRRGKEPATRLHLHAFRLEFEFPLDGQKYSFESPVPFCCRTCVE